MPNQTIKTPCVGLCSTVYGDLVCRGCKRFHHEVINWNGYNEEEKRAVWLRLEQLLSQVMASKLEVFDPQRLRLQLEQRKIRFVPHQSEYCWAYQLIARGARVINNLEAYGMVLMPEFRDWNLPELRDAIDREFFLLSEAHYQRYIAPGFLKDAFGGFLKASRASPLPQWISVLTEIHCGSGLARDGVLPGATDLNAEPIPPDDPRSPAA